VLLYPSSFCTFLYSLPDIVCYNIKLALIGMAARQNHFRVHFRLHPVCSSYLFWGVLFVQLAVIAETVQLVCGPVDASYLERTRSRNVLNMHERLFLHVIWMLHDKP